MINPIEAADKLINAVDDNLYSEQESQADRTERLRIDMQSDSKLSKALRPAITILAGLVWAFAIVYSFWAKAPDMALISASSVFMTCIGFYFHSRRQEKILAKKTVAAIRIEKMKIREGKKESRHKRKIERKNS